MNFCLGNAIKYIWRADLKADAVEDLLKARCYLDFEIERRTAINIQTKSGADMNAQTNQPQKPSIGRVVIFRSSDRERHFNGSTDHPAIITRVWSDSCVNLKVLPDCGQPYDATSSVQVNPEDDTAHGWFWPPRV